MVGGLRRLSFRDRISRVRSLGFGVAAECTRRRGKTGMRMIGFDPWLFDWFLQKRGLGWVIHRTQYKMAFSIYNKY